MIVLPAEQVIRLYQLNDLVKASECTAPHVLHHMVGVLQHIMMVNILQHKVANINFFYWRHC